MDVARWRAGEIGVDVDRTDDDVVLVRLIGPGLV